MKLTPEQIKQFQQLADDYVVIFTKRKQDGPERFEVNIACLRAMEQVLKTYSKLLNGLAEALEDIDEENTLNELQETAKLLSFPPEAMKKINATFLSDPRITLLNFQENTNFLYGQRICNYKICFSDGFEINMPSLEQRVLEKAKVIFNTKMNELLLKDKVHSTQRVVNI